MGRGAGRDGAFIARTDSLRLAFAPGGPRRRQGDRAVSAYREIAEYGTELVVATSALATGAASGLGAPAVPLVTLAAIGGGLRASCADNACRAGINRAPRDMEAAPDIAEDDIARARLTLKERGGTIRLDPARLSAAVRDGSFARDTVLAALPDLSDDPPVRAILTRAVDAALAACMENDAFQTALTRQLLLDAAAAQGVTLRVLERVERKIDDLGARLDDIEGQSRDTLEAMALSFGDPAPEERALPDLKAAAKDAIDRGDLEEVETLLARVQEVELEEAAKSAELRADNALLRGRVEQAYTLLSVAADSFLPVNPSEPGRRRWTYANRLCAHGRRFGGLGLLKCVKMSKGALQDLDEEKNQSDWWAAQVMLGNALRIQGRRTAGPSGADLLGEAVAAYRAALRVRTEADHPVDWAKTTQNLAAAITEQGFRTAGEAGTALLAEAEAAYRDALRVLTEADHPVNWAMTIHNLGNALLQRGSRTAGEASDALLAAAVTAYRDALRVFTEADDPVGWALTTQNLACELKKQGIRTSGQVGTKLMAEAVAVYRDALRVRTEADHPVDWAVTKNNMAETERDRADHAACTNPRPHLEAALGHIEEALTVYDPKHMAVRHEEAVRLRDDIRAKLASLRPGRARHACQG